ncbi:alpha-methylacyl-CoA racemase [Pyronema domesticum]|uniref:Similar to Alpha-methylacyl-CoA racemase acc. no. Q9UHK6 n=1 Tax=Pyronema omphalodes (strain CBS 100304) TaxID=1076935 RepID=U4L5I1_PYROM|nr:alpha-methylacyl-CoA racemase [Pyronema domesticum]CCX05310.1 Similar to Alpha-methylacyl-CoA racemase; acc. no. Q9UHK6 [Pyronema omphalodes CBS 100304]
MTSPPPLTNLLVLEFAGLAPGPFAGKLLSDHGARVLRIDRSHSTSVPTPDLLASHKRSLRVNLKSPPGIALIRSLSSKADIIIDPFRPGVLEKLGLGPEVLLKQNPRLIFARLAGFRRDGKYSAMAGHDINYLAVSGALSLLGREGENPFPPTNLLADFAGGGMVCFLGILLALIQRSITGKGQVVEANMVDGAGYLASFPRFLMMRELGIWDGERGTNLLDGGVPWYETYKTKDGGYMAVGALEPQFYEAFIKGLLPGREVPDRMEKENWGLLKGMFTEAFLQRDRKEWEMVFDGTDACVTPVKTFKELKEEGYQQRPVVTLKDSPAKDSDGWEGELVIPGDGEKEALEEWWGLKEGMDWESKDGEVRLAETKSKL